MDDATRTAIIIAAAQAAGPDAGDGNWGIAVSEKAASIAAMVSPHSPVSKLVTDMAEAKAFTATILEVKKEQSSTRALVSLKTRPSEHHPSGVEPARTDRLRGRPPWLSSSTRRFRVRGPAPGSRPS